MSNVWLIKISDNRRKENIKRSREEKEQDREKNKKMKRLYCLNRTLKKYTA